MQKNWYIVCLMHNVILQLDEFPFFVGREAHDGGNSLAMDESFISRNQFALDMRAGRMWYVNQSTTNLALVDGGYPFELELSPDKVHLVKLGDIFIGIGTDVEAVYLAVLDVSPDLFKAFVNGNEVGPLLTEHLYEACERGIFDETTTVYNLRDPDAVYNVVELLEQLR